MAIVGTKARFNKLRSKTLVKKVEVGTINCLFQSKERKTVSIIISIE